MTCAATRGQHRGKNGTAEGHTMEAITADNRPAISSCMQDREAIQNRIEYFTSKLKEKEDEREIEFKANGVSARYKSISNRMSSLKNDIKKWEERLAALSDT
jgi:chromosome segregation ATPase